MKVKYFTANYGFICEENKTVNVPSALGAYTGETFQFEANKYDEHTELYWKHNGSYHVAEYILEKSTDGVAFEPINAQPSLGGNATEVYEDFDFEPATGDNYYRLKMIDVDGSVYYSAVQIVRFEDLINYTLFPNPANGFVKVNLETVVGVENVSITMFNDLGLEVKRFDMTEVYSKYYQMDIRDVREGHYIVWLNVPGKRPIAKTLVVGRL